SFGHRAITAFHARCTSGQLLPRLPFGTHDSVAGLLGVLRHRRIASHELRTPLAVVLGYASFLRNQVTEEGGEQLNMVLSSAMKLRNLIDDMVNLRHVKNDDVQLETSIFSMRDLIAEALVEFQTLINAKSLRVSVQLVEGNDDAVDIEADRQKVYLIVANIISNAVKFTPENGLIAVSLSRLDHSIQIQVSDTGVGIPDGQISRIFEDFYQVEHSLTRRFEGLGIGLSIAKGMTDVHNGEIFAQSVLNRGSQFVVRLPISQQNLSY
ncbi:MAG: HAMP domain-containing sensor histidine kinase, partial [Chloroflexota bacterium]